jgi:hypothetical protein
VAGRKDEPPVTLYLAIFDNVLHRLRFSKFLAVVRADIPEVLTWILFWFTLCCTFTFKFGIDPLLSEC